jgi:predicted nucleotidyltransferase
VLIPNRLGKSIEEDELRVRDRDSPVTKEGLIFRVYGYRHPPRSCVCDVEYAPQEVYRSDDPRSIRQSPSKCYYKFYTDGGLQFVVNNYPEYQVFDQQLETKLVGLASEQIVEVRRPRERLDSLTKEDKSSEDKLLAALQEVMDMVTSNSSLRRRDFGVFGSILHGFHHPNFSDIDLIVYGRRNTQILRETLWSLYCSPRGQLVNEFDDMTKWAEGRRWFFEEISLKEFCRLSKRKMIYGIYRSEKAKRSFKVEFEPVKDWSEINEEYDSNTKIRKIGWIRAIAEVLDDRDSYFMPSVYSVEVKKMLKGSNPGPIDRVVSFVEEFRGLAEVGEKILVEGNLEEVGDSKRKYYQIVLTRTKDYYKQLLKPLP